jgi:hypothetical protein
MFFFDPLRQEFVFYRISRISLIFPVKMFHFHISSWILQAKWASVFIEKDAIFLEKGKHETGQYFR